MMGSELSKLAVRLYGMGGNAMPGTGDGIEQLAVENAKEAVFAFLEKTDLGVRLKQWVLFRQVSLTNPEEVRTFKNIQADLKPFCAPEGVPTIDPDALPPTDEHGEPQFFRIERPNTALDLSILYLHQKYIAFMASKKDLSKQCQTANFADKLNIGFNPLVHITDKYLIYGWIKQAQGAGKKTAELRTETEKYDRETEEHRLRADSLKNNILRVCSNTLSKALGATFCTAGVKLTADAIKSTFAGIMEETTSDFDTLNEAEILAEAHKLLAEARFAHVRTSLLPSNAVVSVVPNSVFTRPLVAQPHELNASMLTNVALSGARQ